MFSPLVVDTRLLNILGLANLFGHGLGTLLLDVASVPRGTTERCVMLAPPFSASIAIKESNTI
ncbi:MAG: hypothetical protein AAGK24_05880, partial [Planctomycetota bacterium]